MKKIVRLTESDLIHLVKRVLKEQAQPQVNNNLKNILKQKVGTGTGRAYKEICTICNQQDLEPNNESAKRAAKEFREAIQGGENPFSNLGGSGIYGNKNSSASKAGMALQKNLKSAEDICNMIKYYSLYSGADEDFCEAVSGELSYKLNSTSNLDLMVGEPIYNILSK